MKIWNYGLLAENYLRDKDIFRDKLKTHKINDNGLFTLSWSALWMHILWKVITVLHLTLAIFQRAFPMPFGYCNVPIFARGTFSAKLEHCVGYILWIIDFFLLLVTYVARNVRKWHSDPKPREMEATSIMSAIARGTSFNISVFDG